MRWPSAKTRGALAVAAVMTLLGTLAWSGWGDAAIGALAQRGIEFESPGFLALLGLLPVLLVLASFSLTEHGPIQRALSGLLRGALIVSIIAALLGPSELSEEPSMTSTVFVVDVSDSISDDALERARSTIEETWRRRGRHSDQEAHIGRGETKQPLAHGRDALVEAAGLRAVDPRGFVAIGGQHLQAGEDQQRHEGRRLPDIDHDHRPHRCLRIRRPGNRLGQ